MLRIVGRGHAFEYCYLLPALQPIGQITPNQFGAEIIVGPNERHRKTVLIQYLCGQAIVDVNERYTGCVCTRQRRNKRLRVRRSDNDGIDVQRNHLIDQRDLLRQIDLVLNAVDD